MSYSLAETQDAPVFTDYTEAIAFLRRRGATGRKLSIRPSENCVGVPAFTSQRADAADLMAVLSLARASSSGETFPEFRLIETFEFLQ